MIAAELPSARPAQPWLLPPAGLVLFEGDSAAPRLSHYFLPRLVLSGRRVLFLDGANCADPRLMARLARQRNIPFAEFSRCLQIARAFTCFQFTELIARVPQFISGFRAEVLIVTAFPELYFDQDIRDWDARAAFEQALRHLRCWACRREPPLAVAVFTSSARQAPSAARRSFLPGVRAAATVLWRFEAGPEGRLALLPGLREPAPPNRAKRAETAAIMRSVR